MSLNRTVRRGFVTGVVVLAPLVVTVFIVQLVYGWLVGIVGPVLGLIPWIPGRFLRPVAVFLLIAGITVVGIAVRHGAGDELMQRFDRLMEAVPGVSVIYSSVRQASMALTDHEDRFERVALVRMPESGLRTIGFVTSTAEGQLADSTDSGETHYNIFLPMAPNPMGGFLVIVPESRLTMTDLSVREGIQLVVTTGISDGGSTDTAEFRVSDDSS